MRCCLRRVQVERGQFAWLGGGNQLTSTAHVRNVVEGLILAAEKGTGGSVYFLADGKPRVSKLFFTRMLATQGVAASERHRSLLPVACLLLTAAPVVDVRVQRVPACPIGCA